MVVRFRDVARANFKVAFLPSLVVILISVAVASYVGVSVRNTEVQNSNSDLLDFATTVADAILSSASQYEQNVLTLASVYASNRNITPYQFSAVAATVVASHSGIVSCGIVQNVTWSERPAWEARISELFGSPVYIHDPDTPSVPSDERPFYFPFYLNNLINSTVIGMDTWMMTDRRASMIVASTAGCPVQSSVFHLSTAPWVMSFLMPVYTCDTSSSRPDLCTIPPLSQRAGSLDSIASIGVRMDQLILNAPNTSLHDVTWCVMTGSSIIFGTCDPSSAAVQSQSTAVPFQLSNYTWNVVLDPQPAFFAAREGKSEIALAVIIALTGSIGAMCASFAILTSRYHSARLLEEEKRLQQEKVQAYHAATRQFLQCTSHDMRAPLQASLNAVTLLRDELGPTTEFATSLMNVILGCATFLEGLMDNVLDVSKIETNRLEMIDSPVLLHVEIGQMIEIIQAAAFTPDNVGIIAELEELPMVTCDVGKLKRVVLNLVSNAAKFTLRGHIRVKMALARDQPIANPGKVLVEFLIQDTGCGMTDSQVAALGTPFVHREASKGGGSGLGVYITKTYVQQFGGQFHVKSKVDEGTTVSFALWLQLGSDGVSGKADAASVASPSSISVSVPMLPPVPRLVLYCEDHPVTRKMMLAMLTRMGLSVDVACDGGEAVTRLRDKVYDFVFIDMQMPVKNGDEVVREFRAWEASTGQKRVPIAALTGNATLEDQDACKASGCDYFLVKPCRREQLMRVLGMRTSTATTPGTANMPDPKTLDNMWSNVGDRAAAPAALDACITAISTPGAGVLGTRWSDAHLSQRQSGGDGGGGDGSASAPISPAKRKALENGAVNGNHHHYHSKDNGNHPNNSSNNTTGLRNLVVAPTAAGEPGEITAVTATNSTPAYTTAAATITSVTAGAGTESLPPSTSRVAQAAAAPSSSTSNPAPQQHTRENGGGNAAGDDGDGDSPSTTSSTTPKQVGGGSSQHQLSSTGRHENARGSIPNSLDEWIVRRASPLNVDVSVSSVPVWNNVNNRVFEVQEAFM